MASGYSGRLVKWYNFGLQNRRRRFDSYIARTYEEAAHVGGLFIGG